MPSPELAVRLDWRAEAIRRTRWSRLLSFGLIGGTTAATYYILAMYGYSFWVIIPFAIVYFGLGYLGMTYFVGMWFGFFTALKGVSRDPFHPVHRARDLADSTRIAILMPVYHEDPRRVGAALGAMWEDLRRYPDCVKFDFYILSDSRKLASVVQEEWVTHILNDEYPDARFVYRRRAHNSSAKLGNISDFLRRWGSQYKYMLMLDADSIVPAESILKMAKIMEGSDQIGIVQAQLHMVFRNTVYARISRFITSLTLTLGNFGSYYFYLGQGYYYGHNALIRVEAFMQHCALPELRKKGPWTAGKPLSHDYVEAALLEGAGYEVWRLPDIPSSEELPTNLIDDMQRETRWMYGSMTYLRVFLVSRINPLYQARLFTSAINYLNPIAGWIFITMGIFGLRYIFEHPAKAYAIMREYKFVFLFSISFLVLSLLARMWLPIIYIWKKRNHKNFGGMAKLIWSYLLFFVYGLLVGPIYMAQFTRMLFSWLTGRKINWGEQNRDDRSLTWAESFRQFWWVSLVGIVLYWIVIDYVFSANTKVVQSVIHLKRWQLLFWYVPLLLGMISSVWFVWFTSREFPVLERMRWFSSPDELEPPPVLSTTKALEQKLTERVSEDVDAADAIFNPWFYARHRELCASRPKKFDFWMEKLQNLEFDELSDREKLVVLSERTLLETYHRRAWLRKNVL